MQRRQATNHSLPKGQTTPRHILQVLKAQPDDLSLDMPDSCRSSDPKEKRSIVLPQIQNPSVSSYNPAKNIQRIHEFFSIAEYLKKHPEEQNQMSTMEAIQAKYMKKFINGVTQKNYKKLRSAILDVVHLSVKKNQVGLLMEAFMVLGQVQVQFGKFQEAFFTFDQLSATASFKLDFQLKLDCLVLQSHIISLQGMHDKALKYLKKALQYAWFLANRKDEIKIYEKIGYEHYMLGDLQRAVYYHTRSIEGLFESDSSVSKTNNEFLKQAETIRQTIKENKRCQEVNSTLLNKLGIQYSDDAPAHRPDQLRRKNLYVQTDMPLEDQVAKSLIAKDMVFEVLSPRNEHTTSPESPTKKKEEHFDLQRYRKQGHPSQLAQKKKPNVREIVQLDYFNCNLPYAKQLALSKQQPADMSPSGRACHDPVSTSLLYCHQSNNRNLRSFNFHLDIKFRVLQEFYIKSLSLFLLE